MYAGACQRMARWEGGWTYFFATSAVFIPEGTSRATTGRWAACRRDLAPRRTERRLYSKANLDSEREEGFKTANLVSLRAFGDLAFALVVYQAQLYATVYADLSADRSLGLRPELLLSLGAVLGVWTVSEAVATQISAAARQAARTSRQAREIAKDFTTFLFSVDSLLDASMPTSDELDEAEAEIFLSWLGEVDDDMATGSRRGARTVQNLADPTKSSVVLRTKLAVRLGLLIPSGNEVNGVLRRMAETDPNAEVQQAARQALDNRAKIVQISSTDDSEETEATVSTSVVVEELKEQSMLRAIPKEELHLLCICAGLAVSLELYESVLGNANDPLHFVGLGWLLSVSGAAVYPNGSKSFRALTTDRLQALRNKIRGQ